MKNLSDYEREQIKAWINGVSYEVAFWSAYLTKEKVEKTKSRLQSNEELTLAGCDVRSIMKVSKDEKPVILDVGCALSYATGTKIDGWDTDFHYIDPLADFYNQILDKKRAPLPRIELGMVEYLTGSVKKNTVSLIIINNALDHSFDPIKGIFESFSTLKQGGILYLYHHKNEAEHENYRGFHQYNISCKNGELMCWRKNSSINISEILGAHAHIDVVDLGDHVVAVITKITDLESEQFFPAEIDKGRFCFQTMYLISMLLDRRISSAYNRRFFLLKIFHWISARFPRECKEKVKQILNTYFSKK